MRIENKEVLITLERQKERDAIRSACFAMMELCNNSIRACRCSNILIRAGVEDVNECENIVQILTELSSQI